MRGLSMNKKIKTIEGSNEAWDSRKLGNDEKYVKTVKLDETMINEALKLKMISIRMQESLIDDMKMIGEIHGIGYQPLIRQIIKRFVECEKKELLRNAAICATKDKGTENECDDLDSEVETVKMSATG